MAPFFIIWTGQALSLFGSQLVQFALVWWLTRMTGSATVLALAMLMAMVPQILLGPIAGALIDRWNRRIVMMVSDGVIAMAIVALAVLYAFNAVQIWHIYALMFIRAAGGAFHWPAMQASTTLMVPEKHLSRIGGLNQSLYGAANIISPPAGALLLEVLPMQGILAIDFGTAAMAIAPLLFIYVPNPRRSRASEATEGVAAVLADLRDGLRFVWGWPGAMALVVIVMLVNLLFGPAVALMPILVTQRFGGGAIELASLQSALGIGIVAGGITLGVWGGFRRRILTAMVAMMLMGLGIAVVGLVPPGAFYLAVATTALIGFMHPFNSGSINAVLQATVPPEMQGRVFTLAMSGGAVMAPIGLIVAGPVADLFGVELWYRFGGVATVLLAASALLSPAIMLIESQKIRASNGGDSAAADEDTVVAEGTIDRPDEIGTADTAGAGSPN